MSDAAVDLSPERWEPDELERYLDMEAAMIWDHEHTMDHPLARGRRGAVVGTSGAPAVRAGLAALQQGGSAMDAALTTALAQIAVNFGSAISYAGILTLVYYDAATGEVTSMNGAYNTVLGETDPLSIPGIPDPLGSPYESNPSGRSALVPGFMRGVEAAHQRFGRVPFEQLFAPAIYFAENGVRVSPQTAMEIIHRQPVLSRREETKAVFTKPDGSWYGQGDVLRQPALADTLRRVAKEGAAYMYTGPWAQRLVEAVRSEGGAMTLEDLARYDVIWQEPLRATYHGHEILAYGLPASGGVNTIEALALAELAGVTARDYRTDPAAFADFIRLTRTLVLAFLPPPVLDALFPEIDLSPEGRLRPETHAALWERVRDGSFDTAVLSIMGAAQPKHSAGVVSVDVDGNACALVQSINCVTWGGTGIFVDGVSIPDSASFQQAQILMAGPGQRLPDPTNPFVCLEDGAARLVSSSIGAGLHERTIQCVVDVLDRGWDPKRAVDTRGFMRSSWGAGGMSTAVGQGWHAPGFLDAVRAQGLEIAEVPDDERRWHDGFWIGISREPGSGELLGGDAGVGSSRAEAF